MIEPIIVADIGGTYARFGIARFNSDFASSTTPTEALSIDFQATFTCADFSSFIECATHYHKSLPDMTIQNGCFAFAAPIMGDELNMTNNHWRIYFPEVKTALGLKRLETMNDFAAQACAIPHLKTEELSVIKTGELISGANKTILGPGTGLGVGALVNCKGIWNPIAGEGGHVGFSYPNILSQDVLNALHNEHQSLSLEMLLSGTGLVNIYRALCKVNGIEVKNYDESDISQLGTCESESDPLCKKTLTLFCEILGAAAGDLALINGSKGGVYLTGGILPRIEDFLKASQFTVTFNQKGKMTHFLDNIPVFLVKKNNPALYGAANWFLDNNPSYNSTKDPINYSTK
ncbi:glucokinase [Aurantivibrio infirmus]